MRPPRRRRCLPLTGTLVAIASLLAALPPVAAQQLEVSTHTLKNGLKMLVHEDRSIPNIALYIFYKVGSRNERPGTTGLSHFFEHMMFNGAKKYGPGEFDRVMESVGGANNAYTTQNVTVYTDWFPRSALEKILELEADRIQNLDLDPKMIESERGVVASERRTGVDADNFELLDEQLWATAYTAHPYQWPVVGWMVDIENWKMEDLQAHFRMGYSPSNATLVAVGDVSHEEMVRLAKKYLEPIPARDPPPQVTTTEPPQLGERRVKVRKFAQLPALIVGHHVPASDHEDFHAIEVFETILLAGQSSRLHRRLVDEDQLALFVSGGWRLSIDPTLFRISTQPRPGVAPARVEQAILEEIHRLEQDPVSARELEKARNILVARLYRGLKSINGKANLLGSYEMYFGDHRKLFDAAAALARVTPEDVQRVARTYFKENNRTVATLEPVDEPAPEKQENE